MFIMAFLNVLFTFFSELFIGNKKKSITFAETI